MIWAIATIAASIAIIAGVWYATSRDLARDREAERIRGIEADTRAEVSRILEAPLEPPSDEAMQAMTERTRKPWRS